MSQEEKLDSSLLEITGAQRYDFQSKEDCWRALQDSAPENRERAIESLIEFSDFHDIVPFVELAKKDSSPGVQQIAIKALGLSGRNEAFEPLLDILQGENTLQITESSILALRHLGDPRALPYIRKVLEKEDRKTIKRDLSELVLQMEETFASLKATEDKLKEEVKEETDREYLEVLLGPCETGDDERPFEHLKSALVKKDRVSIINLGSLTRDQNEKTRGRAILALSHIPFTEDTKEALFGALKDESDSIRFQALHILLKERDPDLPERLFPLLSDENPIIAQEVSRFLLDNHNAGILQMATEALESQSGIVKIRAASFLAKTDNESVMPDIIGLLQDTQQPVDVIIEIISSLKARRAQYVGRALPALLKKGEKQILKSLALYFRKVNDPNLYGVLRKNLVSGDPRIRHGSAYLVGQSEDRRSIGSIIALLQDPYDSIKIQAGWSLAHMKAIETFEDILSVYNESKDLKIRKAFLEILSRLDLPRGLPVILDASRDISAEIRYHAANLLALYTEDGKAGAVEALQKSLKDEDMRVIFISINSLLNLGVEHLDASAEELLSVLKAYLYDKRQPSAFRVKSVNNIKHILKEGSIEILVNILQAEEDEKVLAAAAEGLSSFEDPAAFESLTSLLSGENPFVRKKIAQALCLKDDPATIPYLLNFLEDFQKAEDTSFDVTIFLVIEHLNRIIRKPLGEDMENKLLSLLRKKSLPIRQMATFHLAYGGGERIREHFIRLIKSPFHSLYYLAALGMARIGDRKAVQPLIDMIMDNELASIQDTKGKAKVEKELDRYYALLDHFDDLEDDDLEAGTAKKVLAATYLSRLKDRSAIEALTRIATDREPRISAAAIKALLCFEEPSIIPLLLELRENRTDFLITNAVNAALRRFKNESRHHLLDSFGSKNAEKRAFAARTFAEIRGLIPGKDLMNFLEDDYWLVRYWTVTAIAMSGERSPEFLSLLTKRLGDSSALVRSGALYAMIYMQDPTFSDTVLSALQDPHFFVRAEASKIAGGLRIKEAEKILTDNLSDFSVSVRSASARALGELGSQEALSKLEKIAATSTSQEKVWSIYASILLKGEKNIDSLATFLRELDDDRPDEILVMKSSKPTTIRYYPGVFKKLTELGYRASPLLYREEFEEFKQGYHEFILRFVKSLDRLYIEKISEAKENQFQAIEALGALGTAEAAEALGEMMKGRREKTLRLAALRSLSSLQVPEALPALIPGLADPSQEIHVKIAGVLKQAKNLMPQIDAYLRGLEIDNKHKNRIFRLLGLAV